MKKSERPDWHPAGAGKEFATRVVAGTESPIPVAKSRSGPRKILGVADYVRGVIEGDRVVLAQAITLVESNAPAHLELAQEVLRELLPRTGNSLRVGVTGVPGVGKSTLIEALGCRLCGEGHQVAVLAVDPSSTLTRGSILGDKTRMERLSRDPASFIRPSPSGGALGGVTRKSRETILICEAAGFDVILVETVGVGQSETAVRAMVDFFLLLMLPGAGDELQGIKRGIMELADALFVNKADGDNQVRAENARAESQRALHYLAPATEGWQTDAFAGSAVSGKGIGEIWSVIERFAAHTRANGALERRRRAQTLDWVRSMVEEQLLARFARHPSVAKARAGIERDVLRGVLPPTVAAQQLIRLGESRHG